MSGVSRCRTVALSGVDGHVVDVEAHLAPGLPSFTLVGLPDAALVEARDRVRAAVLTSGCSWPQQRVTVALSPGDLPKAGAAFDLAVAVAVLGAARQVPHAAAARTVVLGELALDGRLRRVRGVLPAVLAAVRAGAARVLVPAGNAAEAALVPGADVVAASSLAEVVALLRGELLPAPLPPGAGRAGARGHAADDGARGRGAPGGGTGPALDDKDLADVLGQLTARWALEVSAAGGHHLYLVGAPGTGKTMLGERLPGLLPDLDLDAALEVTAVHSVAGALPPDVPLVDRPPFRAPHHTATVAAVVGGGSGVPRPGAASLAHRGVLLLDEAGEFGPRVLDALRQPLESGEVHLSRARGSARYPARFRLVLATNPCPCGLAVGSGLSCTCSPLARRRYVHRLSGPLLDRVDLRLEVLPPTRVDLSAASAPEPSAVVAQRVLLAQDRARRRLRGTPWELNADLPGRELRRAFAPHPDALGLLEGRVHAGGTLRGSDRVLRVAWTLADLAGRDRPGRDEVAAALALREPVGGVAA